MHAVQGGGAWSRRHAARSRGEEVRHFLHRDRRRHQAKVLSLLQGGARQRCHASARSNRVRHHAYCRHPGGTGCGEGYGCGHVANPPRARLLPDRQHCLGPGFHCGCGWDGHAGYGEGEKEVRDPPPPPLPSEDDMRKALLSWRERGQDQESVSSWGLSSSSSKK